jgi:hypothetical protein
MKQRHPKHFSTAVTKIKTQTGENRCAEIVDRSTSLIRKWSDPDQTSIPNLEQAALLDEAFVRGGFGKPPLLELYGELMSDALSEASKKSEPVNMLLAALTVQGVIGDLSEAIRGALSEDGDGGRTITPRERTTILQILERLDDQVDAMEDAVEGC